MNKIKPRILYTLQYSIRRWQVIQIQDNYDQDKDIISPDGHNGGQAVLQALSC